MAGCIQLAPVTLALPVNIYPISRELKDSFRETGYKSSCVFQIIFNVRFAPFTHTHTLESLMMEALLWAFDLHM